ncbi:hypothetical protein Desru_1003 [Desulforamulus ruminis DSM 2154]|uniref:Uncharacterized protein n=1 Tax=Desulforamulus ruminis (strain ATCC 23193 / DSM 2154 / NCIMB 8452 / DL) TaxID=696281 RepID=F6DL57_DESRL|nr:hypothetical protein Desru_1003 [Desulforamulus ruminis DSM 2154]
MSTCSICNKEVSRLLECSLCGNEVCSSCYEQCNSCKQWFCHRHLICIYKRVHLCDHCYADQLRNSE